MKRIRYSQEGLSTMLEWLGISSKELEEMTDKEKARFVNDLRVVASKINELLNIVPDDSELVDIISDLEGNKFYDLVFNRVTDMKNVLGNLDELNRMVNEALVFIEGEKAE